MTTSKLRRPALLETYPAVGEVKVLILAANPGPRLGDGSENRPGALVEIGGRPVIWHSMMNFAARGFGDFLIATGYRSDDIKRYVSDYNQLDGDLDVNLGDGRVDRGEGRGQAWNADLIETGDETGSAGRIKRAGAGLASGTILLDTGDSLSDIDVEDFLEFHQSHGKLVTAAAVRPVARFGRLAIEAGQVIEFAEKPQLEEGWISSGLFALEAGALDYIHEDKADWENETLDRLARDGELDAYKHSGFWRRIETLRDRQALEDLWQAGNAAWKTLEDLGEDAGKA